MIWSVSYHVCFFSELKFFFFSSVSAAAQRLIHTANISTNAVLDKKARFTCKPKFLLVLQTMPEVDKNKTVFTYEEVRSRTSDDAVFTFLHFRSHYFFQLTY